MKQFILYLFVLSMLATAACSAVKPVADSASAAPVIAGEVHQLQLGSTLWGLRAAIAEKPGTMIFMKDNMLVFVWNLKDAWAFACIDSTKQKAVEDIAKIAGQATSPKTMGDLSDFLKQHGWEIVGAKQVPQALRVAITGASSWLASLATSMTTFLVLPVNATGLPEEYQKLQEWQ